MRDIIVLMIILEDGIVMWMKNLNKFKQHKYILGSIILIGLLIVFISSSFAISVPVSSIEIKSESLNYDKKEQGSWKTVKSAVWTGKNKARISFDVDTVEKNINKDKDIILVIDSSSSMSSNISDVLLEVLNELESDSNTNRVALISFDSRARVLSDFTSDLDSIYTLVNELTISGNTNYYRALLKVDDLLQDYSFSNSKDTSVIFITDGYPTSAVPNEVSEYNYLKEEYPNLDIRAIQYNNSDVVLDEIKNISDKQYIANSNNIREVLHRAMFGVSSYDNFVIEDNVSSYFSIDSVSSSLGDVDINNNKITWSMNDNIFDSGTKVKLNIDINLKDEYKNIEGLYETNSSEVITSSINGINEDITSSNSPILANSYTVIYEDNAPSTCFVTNVPNSSKYYVFDTVSISNIIPVCFGYQFKEWEIVNENVTKINSDNFIMPSENVTLKATWSRLGLIKSSNGTVSEATTLYKVIESEAISGGLAKEYTGNHQDSMTETGNKKIYYYSGNNVDDGNTVKEKNNVLFAGHCWQMIRTTDTGGVKMIYNGEPDSNNQCGTDRGTHVGYAGDDTIALNSNYYYGTSYEYDSSSKKFSLAGTITNGTWSDSTYQDLLGKYTCLSSSLSGTCSTLYYVEKYSSISKAHVLKIDSNSHYSVFGTEKFNADSVSLAYAGYMYNTVYSYYQNSFVTNKVYEQSSSTSNKSYYYADSLGVSDRTYSLTNPYRVSSLSDAAGKYTLLNTSMNVAESRKAYYVVAVEDSTIYYINFLNGKTLDDYIDTYTYGDSYIDNGDDTYTIENPNTITTLEYFNNYSKLIGKYVCTNSDSDSCDNLIYISSATKTSFEYLSKKLHTYKFSNSFTYEDGKYKLDENSVELWAFGNDETNNKLDSARYACIETLTINTPTLNTASLNATLNPTLNPTITLNAISECTTLSYVFYFNPTFSNYLYYINLSDGKDINDAIDEMLYDDSVNTTNSTIKSAIDAWYERYMTDYTDYLEDVIFCNDRRIRSLEGWSPTLGSVANYLQFQENNVTDDLSCVNETDKFSVSNDKAKLKYPIGLSTSPEMGLLGYNARNGGESYWALSPASFAYVNTHVRFLDNTGGLYSNVVNASYGVRPVISLKPGTSYISGDGSTSSPYVVE